MEAGRIPCPKLPPPGPPDHPGPRLLVTGFGSFPGIPANPSARLARLLARGPGARRARTDLLLLATRWDAAAAFPAFLDRAVPDIVLMLGVAARRRRVSIESVARNATGVFPDAARRRPTSRPLEPGAPAQRPLAASPAPLLAALRNAGVPADISRHAGRYVCNALAFRAYGWARAGRRADGGPRLAVFVHVPLPRPGRRSMAHLARALEALLAALLAQYRQGRLRG